MNRKICKRNLLCLLLSLVMVVSLFPAGVLADGLAGEGTEESPYLIKTADDLKSFRDIVNTADSSSACAVLTDDIDLKNEEWMPINSLSGYPTTAYAGVFDGDFHTITGLSVNASATNQGLFAVINGAEIKNLNVEGSVYSDKAYVGGIVGKVQQGKLTNCSFSGTVETGATSSSAYAGGITGYAGNTAAQTADISGCVSNAAVKGGVAGGITGYAKYTTITNCYNTGAISGTSRSGGIAGQLQNNCIVENCYNIGEISGSDTASDICDFLYSSAKLTNCWGKTQLSGAGAGTTEGGGIITASDALLESLGSAFTADDNDINEGYPVLLWQKNNAPVPKDPKISITGGAALYMTNSGAMPQTTLSVNYTDMDAVPIEWATDNGDVITIEPPAEPDENNTKLIVKAKNPGTAVVTASTEDGAYTAEQEIKVMPFVTTVEIGGQAVVGQTVAAKVNVLGGREYDYENYPELNYQWKYLTADDYDEGNTGASSYKNIEGAINREFTIPNELKGAYLSFSVWYNGEDRTPSRPVKIVSGDYPVLQADRDALTIDTSDIKENKTIVLPRESEHGFEIIWSSSHTDIINTITGEVTLSAEDTTDVTLTATLSTNDNETLSKNFVIKVYSVKAIDEEKSVLAADKDALMIDTSDIEENTTIELPVSGEHSQITWVSSDSDIINPETGVVTLPQSGGIVSVTLTAMLTYKEHTDTKEFTIQVYSLGKIEQEKSDLEYDRATLTIDTTDIKASKVIELPVVGAKGSQITWSSSNSDVINSETGVVTLPKTDIVTVTLTATITLNGRTAERIFEINVYSQKALDDEARDKKLAQLQDIAAKLGDYYKMYPVFGTDTNVLDILEEDFAGKDVNCDEFDTAIKNVEEIYGGAGIDSDGNITYFYVDPNGTPAIRMGSYTVTFTISIDDAEYDFDVPVIIYWDTDKVKAVMKNEILDNVTDASILDENSSLDNVTGNLSLPKVVDDKKWTLISWSSSDENVLAISAESQGTADTLFNPYTGVVKRGAEDKTVTLTATFTFMLTNDITGNEQPVTMNKVFDVTVKAIGSEQIEAIERELNAKLDSGFEKTGLTDSVTGEKLFFDGEKYTAHNDIQLPTTRDFGIDGKYYPVTLSSSNDAVIKTPDVNNAARAQVYRPAVGKDSADVKLIVTITDTNSNISVSRTFDIVVPAITSDEVESEKTLMEKVKSAYFDGIKGENAEPQNISTNLNPFMEVYEENGTLVWVRDSKNKVNHGIVPVALEGWEELEAWRLFRSSNPAAITHENLLVTMQKNAKAVTVTSALSSETLGKYGKLYIDDPKAYADYASLAELYYQEVSQPLVVRGKTTETDNFRPMAVEETITVYFRLQSSDSTLIETTAYKNLDETLTVFDIFKKALSENGYTYENRGSYVYSITTPEGTTFAELDEGANSGWMYKVNGEAPEVNMGGCGLSNGDEILVYFTKDYMEGKYPQVTDEPSSGNTHTSKASSKNNANEENKINEEANKPEKTESPAPEKTGSTEKDAAVSYKDTSGHWAESAIQYVTDLGIMQGIGNDEFAPDSSMTRAMFVTMLYRLENEPETALSEFIDIESGSWYEKAVSWADKNGIVAGISDTEFAPGLNINREQIAAIMYRYAKFKGYAPDGAANVSYSDEMSISGYAKEAVSWAEANSIMVGMGDGSFAPKRIATRAESAVVFMRMIDFIDIV
ncbi:MAG: S-layer homology domain-containing protein [Oscillospiraceae bacterium]|nr:S-layer homology domain-containing protein [Oscillospiraceae bacterium]